MEFTNAPRSIISDGTPLFFNSMETARPIGPAPIIITILCVFCDSDLNLYSEKTLFEIFSFRLHSDPKAAETALRGQPSDRSN